MLTFLMIAMIAFFVTSGVFLSIEAGKRSQMEAAKVAAPDGGVSSVSQRKAPHSAMESGKSEMPKAA